MYLYDIINFFNKDNKKVLDADSSANYFILQKPENDKVGGIHAENLRIKNSSNKCIGILDYIKPTISIKRDTLLNELLKNNISDNIVDSYLSSDLTWNTPRKVKYKSTAPNTGDWTITDCVVYSPLFIIHVSTQSSDATEDGNGGGNLYVVSGAIGGRSPTGSMYSIGPSQQPGTNIFMTFPTSTTVVVKVAYAANNEHVYAFQ